MKKHPVDDLFKRRLEGLERAPSENAWLKIQEKQLARIRPVKHRSAVWGWYAAAGVVAAVMGGYLVWQNQQGVSPGTIHSQQTVAITKPLRSDSAVLPKANANKPVEQLAAVEKKDYGLVNSEPKVLSQTTEAPDIAKKQIAQRPLAIPAPVQDAPVAAINERPSVSVNAIQPEPVNIPVTQDIKILPDEPAVSQVNKPEPTRTIVVTVETGSNEAEEKPRNTRFARVFRQLKNARAGEKVDWDEVGFNPKNLVARVDDRLRSKDEKKDHSKEKTKL
ncbi:hypothetical protein LZD49_13600 [Dyadobacter sp. CY261]|uniref:hypothetical protein n=1 Tax=Dyadobacter sp. CY261 TaxID=2907203 RepID=UPI001F188FFF|nr:hypothetical protein [Dyadobacter sp. CY261]MCF0071507.1 hypothetical protein [Dyadobacter sp. CY261]